MSLRSRNRRAAMQAAQRSALDLFEVHGFTAVTVEDVAIAAGMSPSTVYRHFRTKERLVLWDELDDRLEGAFREHLRRGSELGPLAAIRAALVAAYSDLAPDQLDLLRRRGSLIDATPNLLAATATELDATRAQIQAALRRCYPKIRSPLRHELAARIAITALVAGFERWQHTKATLPRAITEAFEAARSVLDSE